METIQIESQKRGQLTDRIKLRSAKLLGYEISQSELRVLPYIQYTLVNSQRLKPEHLNEEEQEILAKYARKGFITDGVSKGKGRPVMSEGITLKVMKQFWDSILEILWLGYVDLHDANICKAHKNIILTEFGELMTYEEAKKTSTLIERRATDKEAAEYIKECEYWRK